MTTTKEIETPVTAQRQFCRFGVVAGTPHSSVPALTLTFDSDTRRLHWCAEHVADAARYAPESDEAAVGECTHGDDCDQCCTDCFRLMDSHCEECGECRCDGADTGECAVALEGDEDEDGDDEDE